MNYLKKLGIIVALALMLIPFAVTPASAQQNGHHGGDRNMRSRRNDDNGRHGDRNMRLRQDDDNNGRRVRRNRNWTHQNRKYWRKHKRHNHHGNFIRRENQ